jgi:hypothetical protein
MQGTQVNKAVWWCILLTILRSCQVSLPSRSKYLARGSSAESQHRKGLEFSVLSCKTSAASANKLV